MKKLSILIILSCLIFPNLAYGGAWTLNQYKVWAEYFTKANWAKNDFDYERNLSKKGNDARSWGWSMAPKIEYGVTNWLTALGGVEYKEQYYKEYSRPPDFGPFSVKNHGVSEVTAGARARFIKEPVVLSAQIKGYIYTGYDDEDPQDQPGLSDKFDAVELRGLIGKKFDEQIPFFYGFESGYRWKNRIATQDVPLFFEFGLWPLKWLLLKTELDGYISHDGTGQLEKEYFVWRIGPTFHLLGGTGDSQVTKSGQACDLTVQYGYTFWGRNTSQDQEVVLKISATF